MVVFAVDMSRRMIELRGDELMIACGWKSHPAKAEAGKPGPSLAGVAVTRGLKCRQEPCGVRE
ncbi:hypothetical protein ACVWXM_009716 [Bradyrhizobium sp. GM7.3]